MTAKGVEVGSVGEGRATNSVKMDTPRPTTRTGPGCGGCLIRDGEFGADLEGLIIGQTERHVCVWEGSLVLDRGRLTLVPVPGRVPSTTRLLRLIKSLSSSSPLRCCSPPYIYITIIIEFIEKTEHCCPKWCYLCMTIHSWGGQHARWESTASKNRGC